MIMSEAVITKYLAPTNTRGSRISVKGYGKRMIISWNYSLNAGDNHYQAALTLLKGYNNDNFRLVCEESTPKGYAFIPA
jgi:hypothetical protein